MHWSVASQVLLLRILTQCKKATIHQPTTMLSTSKHVLFPGHNHLLTTGVMTWHFNYCTNIRTFWEVDSMVVSWWIVACLASVTAQNIALDVGSSDSPHGYHTKLESDMQSYKSGGKHYAQKSCWVTNLQDSCQQKIWPFVSTEAEEAIRGKMTGIVRVIEDSEISLLDNQFQFRIVSRLK